MGNGVSGERGFPRNIRIAEAEHYQTHDIEKFKQFKELNANFEKDLVNEEYWQIFDYLKNIFE